MMAAAEAREASLRRVFTRYDVDGSGTIDASELALLLVDLQFDDRVVDEEFAKADKDASRAISFGTCGVAAVARRVLPPGVGGSTGTFCGGHTCRVRCLCAVRLAAHGSHVRQTSSASTTTACWGTLRPRPAA